MTLVTLIEQVKEEKPNSFTPEKLTSFVNDIEAQIQDELDGDKKFKPYDYSEDGSVDLLAPAPYDRLYKSYLKAQIDYANEEIELYANNIAQFNQDYTDYLNYIVRENKAVNRVPPRFKNIF